MRILNRLLCSLDKCFHNSPSNSRRLLVSKDWQVKTRLCNKVNKISDIPYAKKRFSKHLHI